MSLNGTRPSCPVCVGVAFGCSGERHFNKSKWRSTEFSCVCWSYIYGCSGERNFIVTNFNIGEMHLSENFAREEFGTELTKTSLRCQEGIQEGVSEGERTRMNIQLYR